MISLTILGAICLAIGIAVFAFAVRESMKNSHGNDELFKESIGNICWGAIVGSILFFSVMCFSISEHKSKSNHQCCEHCEDNTMVIKP